jgi:hypothetical protein
MNNIIKGGRSNPRWLVLNSTIEAVKEGRDVTLLDTTDAAFKRFHWCVCKFFKTVLRQFRHDFCGRCK